MEQKGSENCSKMAPKCGDWIGGKFVFWGPVGHLGTNWVQRCPQVATGAQNDQTLTKHIHNYSKNATHISSQTVFKTVSEAAFSERLPFQMALPKVQISPHHVLKLQIPTSSSVQFSK